MAILPDRPLSLAMSAVLGLAYAVVLLIVFVAVKIVYNLFFHPLAKYPGPLLWRASRLPASYHHASGDLYKCITAFHAQYGATVRIAPDELSFTSPDAWQNIFNSRPQLPKSRYHFPPSDPEKFPDSMITAPDADHARLRRLTGPGFTQNGLYEVEPVMQQYSDLLISQLTVASTEGPQNMVEWFLWTLNDVIGQLALDQRFECLAKRRMHPWPHFLLGSLKAAATINQISRFGLLRLMGPLIPQKIIDAREVFVDTATHSVKQRLERGSEEDKGRPDFIGLMLREMKGREGLSELEIIANSTLLVAGGSETTSSCLTSMLYYLCKTPRVMKKLREEIRRTFATSEEITLRATTAMPYLAATVEEALRIFPIASYITPRVTHPGGHTIAGEWIPGNTYVTMGQWYMGRSEKFFENAMEFRPERWLADENSPSGRPIKEVMNIFSLGPRNCLGKQMALLEARLVIAKLLWHFDMELDGEHESWVDDARFYILWELQPLNVKLTPVKK